MTDTAPAAAAPLVNRAIRRDVARALAALTQWPHPDDAQRRAIAEHLVWMLEPVARVEAPAAVASDGVIGAARRYADDAPAAERHALGVSRRLERAYRRRTYRCWYLPEHCGLKRNLSAHVRVDVAAPADTVWRVILDPTRTAEWSHECSGAQFLDGATESGLGVRFKGVNRSGRTTWSRVCTIFAFEPGREFGYVTSSGTGDGGGPDAVVRRSDGRAA